ncbi:hypothetical protein FQN55_008290 [Onygenales sp. PD_40]|nr:hypothetical protein FQN55_008290 [Onygenales sp. PD_40]KAK2774304.1 hypothetical protein FQN52_004288 [Onygenales sp. PD_12]KAK2791236.1 hypothetical protein FQN53_006077 [Emmonsiellopsis sp. PD_33]KAK2800323.1 hypothetical protein FQN51_006231 [Onygenales sp. PD_10]
MHFINPISLSLSLLLLPLVHACTPSIPPSSPTGGPAPPFPTIIPGSDAPADSATTGFVLNHFSLNVNNLTASIDFYTRVFGMRLIFTFRATEKMSISYLAHSHGGKNGTAYQTTAELNRNKNNMEGLIELLHYDYEDPKGDDKHPATTELDNTFSHVGIVVPDSKVVEGRLEEFGVPVLKGVGGEVTERAKEVVARAYGLGKLWKEKREEAEELVKLLLGAVPGVDEFVYATDPDGNLIEVQPQELEQLPI